MMAKVVASPSLEGGEEAEVAEEEALKTRATFSAFTTKKFGHEKADCWVKKQAIRCQSSCRRRRGQ